MVLRPAFLQDVPALASLGRSAFIASFGHLYRQEDLGAFLEKVYSHQAIADDVTHARRAVHTAWQDDRLVGFCKLGLDCRWRQYARRSNVIELMQLYADPALTGRGIGAALMQWVLATARERGAGEIQLSVWSENFDAQRFYTRYGFEKVADVDFWVGNHRDDEFLFALLL